MLVTDPGYMSKTRHARDDDSLLEIVRILVFVQLAIAIVTSIESMVFGAFSGSPGPALLTLVAAGLTTVFYIGLGRRSPRSRRWADSLPGRLDRVRLDRSAARDLSGRQSSGANSAADPNRAAICDLPDASQASGASRILGRTRPELADFRGCHYQGPEPCDGMKTTTCRFPTVV